MSITPTTGAPFLDFMPPMTPPMTRLEAARLAVAHHREEGSDDAELIGTANALAAFVTDGTVPDSPDAPRIAVTNDGETLAVLIDGETVASITHAQAGHEGMRAVEQAAVRVAHALGGEIDGIDR